MFGRLRVGVKRLRVVQPGEGDHVAFVDVDRFGLKLLTDPQVVEVSNAPAGKAYAALAAGSGQLTPVPPRPQ